MARSLLRLVALPVTIIALTLFASAPTPTSGASAENVIEEFSVTRGGDIIVVPVIIEKNRYQFVLDTGSTCSCFNRRHREMLGIPRRTVNGRVPGGDRRVEQFVAPGMSLGTIALTTDAEVVCDDLSNFEPFAGCAIDGILGMDALRHLVVNIDFDDGKVRILKSAEGAPGRRVAIIWHQRRHMREGPFILAKIADARHEFLVDSGSIWSTVGTMDIEPFDAEVTRGSIVRLRSLYTSESTGGSSVVSLGRAQNLEVAGFRHNDVILGREAFWNAFGVAFLARYVVTFDFPNSVVYLTPGKRFAVPDRLDASGISTGRRENAIFIDEVRRRTPGDLAGVRPGDLILRIDGEATTHWSLYRLDRILAAPASHTLVIRRGDAEHELRLVIPWAENGDRSK